MTCDYCRSVNAEDDHRCRRCGRRLMGTAMAAPPEYAEGALRAVGANALAAAIATVEMPRTQALRPPPPPVAKPKSDTTQSSLFLDDNVIPFERRSAPPAAPAQPETTELFPPRPVAKAKAASRKPAAETAQSTLDFLPPKPQTTRLLKTTVEAAIRCEALPASPMHRAGAAALDAGLIAVACGLFFGLFAIFGGDMVWNKQTIPILGALVVLIALLYGFVWMLADRETPGLQWADLKIVSFSGFPPDRKTRALRMMGCFLSFCSGMIGIFWALVDEEKLTWHDHMSKTFPTLRDSRSHLIRQ